MMRSCASAEFSSPLFKVSRMVTNSLSSTGGSKASAPTVNRFCRFQSAVNGHGITADHIAVAFRLQPECGCSGQNLPHQFLFFLPFTSLIQSGKPPRKSEKLLGRPQASITERIYNVHAATAPHRTHIANEPPCNKLLSAFIHINHPSFIHKKILLSFPFWL